MLIGKNAIITGANGGIGSAIVETFARNGANVWACMRCENEEIKNHFLELSKKYNVDIECLFFDMEDSAAMKEAVKHIIKEKRSIDIIVNNAGIAQYDAFSVMPFETLNHILSVNYSMPLQFTQIICRRMNKQGASIVFLSSVAGINGVCGNTAYGASKAAINHTIKVLAKELAPQKIRVNAVAPGMVNTKMKNKADETTWDKMVESTALKRVATPEEVANVIAFLSSDLASYVTGQIIRVDGGMD